MRLGRLVVADEAEREDGRVVCPVEVMMRIMFISRVDAEAVRERMPATRRRSVPQHGAISDHGND